jgi:hypothetical protein
MTVSDVKTILCHPDGAYLVVSPTLWNDPTYVVTERMRHDFRLMPEEWRKELTERFAVVGLPEWPGEYVDLFSLVQSAS